MITYTLECMEEQESYEGYFAYDTEAENQEAIEWIRDQLDSGNGWAWCCARVVASINIDGEPFQGDAYLGGCSYLSEDDFRESGYYADMCAEAKSDLIDKLNYAVKLGEISKRALKEIK